MKLFCSATVAAALCVLGCMLAGTCSAAISTSNVVVKAMERTGDKLFEKKLVYPRAFENGPKISASTPFSVSFDAASDKTSKALRLDQAFVSFRNAETGDEVAFAAKAGKAGSYRMDMTRKQFRSHLATAPGTYAVALVLGSFDEGGLFYHLGEVQVAGKRRSSASDVSYGPRPEIHHRFADPQRMPNVLLSLVFAGLVAAPLLALAGVWARLGVNADNLAKEPAGSTAFMVLVAAYMALAIAYWIGVRLLPTLAYMLALALPTYLVGQYALNRRIQLGI